MEEITDYEFRLLGVCLGINIDFYESLKVEFKKIPKPNKNKGICLHSNDKHVEIIYRLESKGYIKIIVGEYSSNYMVTNEGRKVFKTYFRKHFNMKPVINEKDKEIIGFLTWLKLNCKNVNMLWKYNETLYTDLELYIKYKEEIEK